MLPSFPWLHQIHRGGGKKRKKENRAYLIIRKRMSISLSKQISTVWLNIERINSRVNSFNATDLSIVSIEVPPLKY